MVDPMTIEIELEADTLRGPKAPRPLDQPLRAHMMDTARAGLEAIAGLAFALGLPVLLMLAMHH